MGGRFPVDFGTVFSHKPGLGWRFEFTLCVTFGRWRFPASPVRLEAVLLRQAGPR
jgi:hypothetical protein